MMDRNAQQPQPNQPVNLQVLADLLGTNDPAFIKEILESFYDSLLKAVPSLDAACKQNDATNARTIAHTMTSSSKYVGAYQLGQYCEAMENAASAADMAMLQKILPQWKAEASRTLQYVKQVL